MNQNITIETIVISGMYSNCYVLYDNDRHGVVVDPGGDPDHIRAFIQQNEITVEAILNTHGHIDHIGANAEIRRVTGAPIHIHSADAAMLTSRLLCGAEWYNIPFQEHTHDHLLTEGQPLDTGHFQFDIVHTPGHSPGCVCLIMESHDLMFAGDLVFRDSIGRYDLPGGNELTMMKSLRRFLEFPDNLAVYPGHGPATTVGRERQQNPFLRRLT